MTELDLYKFITDNSVEWHRHNRYNRDGEDDVIIFPYIFQLEEFSKLFKNYDEGLDIKLMDGYVCIWMRDLCEYYGVEMNNVFKGNNYDE